MSVLIRTDYRNFGENYLGFLSSLCPDINVNVTIRPINEEGQMHSPFINPDLTCHGTFLVEYSEMEINRLALSTDEQHACLMHEIGHLILKKIFPCNMNDYLDSFFKESFCDMIAFTAGLGNNMISALRKMIVNYPEIQDDLNRRLLRLQEI